MLAFGLLTGGPLVPMDDYGELGANIVDEDKPDTLSSEFGGKPVSISKGAITVETTELSSFEPTDTSAYEEGALPQLFTMTITNGTKKPLDLFSVAIVRTDIAGNTQAVCTDLFDESLGLNGVPFEPVPVGGKVDFKWGMACPGKKGSKIDVTIAITPKEEVQFTGSLA